VAEQPVKEQELALAKQLIAQQASASFEPATYTDVVRERVQAAIDKKVEEGTEIAIADEPTSATSGKIIDLMEALRGMTQCRSIRSSCRCRRTLLKPRA
jgi:non-homologous end joining protein Ku